MKWSICKFLVRTGFAALLITCHSLAVKCQAQVIKAHIYPSALNLVPEGITADLRTGKIYVSSVGLQKIVVIEQSGQVSDFIASKTEGFGDGLGMRIDSRKNILWALSSIRKDSVFTSMIHGFDLKTGKVLNRFVLKDTIPHLFNDLVITETGELLITDTYASSIYKYTPATRQLSEWIPAGKFKYPNGITWGGRKALYVATYGNGILHIDAQTREVSPMPGFKDSSYAFGLDGLVYRDRALFGVYNLKGYDANAVIRYNLDRSGKLIQSETVLDSGNLNFKGPTTAVILNDVLYVIANSHLDQFNQNKESIQGIEKALTPLTLLLYPIKR
jgi:sugar lactone lactonase YvrE